MCKYWIDYECKTKTYQEVAETANEINKVAAVVAPDTYIQLWLYAHKYPLIVDRNTPEGYYLSLGINRLQELGYIECGSADEEDDYSMIWIIK